MLQKLTNADRDAVLRYVAAEPEMNLFFIGDVENCGLEGDTAAVYASVGNGRWDGLVLRFYDYFTFYSDHTDFAAEPVAEFLYRQAMDSLAGKYELVERLAPYWPAWKLRPTYMARCSRPAQMPLPAGIALRRLTPADAGELCALYATIAEFRHTYDTPEKCAREALRTAEKLGRGSLGIGAYAGGALVSAVTTSADNSRSAMLIGMATREGWRCRGIAGAVMAAAVRAVLAGGRAFACLFYDNPAAGRIYRRVGFAELGRYGMLQPRED
jgi:predicted GNAT family acetyltransferase